MSTRTHCLPNSSSCSGQRASLVMALALLLGGCGVAYKPLTVGELSRRYAGGESAEALVAAVEQSDTVYRLHSHQRAQLLQDEVLPPPVVAAMDQTLVEALGREALVLNSYEPWVGYIYGDDGYWYGECAFSPWGLLSGLCSQEADVLYFLDSEE